MASSTVEYNGAYVPSLAANPLLPLLLISLAKQKHAPRTTASFSEEYDYIVVGAGSAGSVVSSRLSEIPCVTVLLLEAGKAPPLLNDVPYLWRYFWFSDLDWAYKTVPQKHSGFALINNQMVWPSGKGIGGTSLINGMAYVRGNKKNYDDWARLGAVGWSYSDVKPYFLKFEDNADPEYLENGYHVVDGPVRVHTSNYEAEIKKPLMEAAKSLGYKIVDSNGPKQTGFYVPQGTIRNSQRCSTGKAYLVPAENRTNLNIVVRAYAKKVLIEDGKAVGVQFDKDGGTFAVRARREVILSAGAVNSPKLLMLSGIGPRKHLEDLEIPVVVDLPVGDNAQDHVVVPVHFQIEPRRPSASPLSQQSIREYIDNRTGILGSLTTLIAFINTQKNSVIDDPVIQLYFSGISSEVVNGSYNLKPEVYEKIFRPFENRTMCVCNTQLLQPQSKGTVRLSSANPYDMPLIDPNYYSNPKI
ncbi:hypothetical protein JTE90_020791 [Oedothorax gibbosus]|uniref:Glucose-methanol-choline oxidoreductase N-terminal domain-containing protein n=1 Tax=Oedothorax gibbosus TaxID=931172 RepID=A0AAV6TUF7_9ARAC|nr:hypothetical protein JTE90_020791 [Oedothorax gibbosus]